MSVSGLLSRIGLPGEKHYTIMQGEEINRSDNNISYIVDVYLLVNKHLPICATCDLTTNWCFSRPTSNHTASIQKNESVNWMFI